MSIYNILDFILLFTISFFTYYAYAKRTYIKIFDYFKIFLIITLSGKFASLTATLLQNFYITKADTYTILILIAFVINILILYFSWKFIFKITKIFVNNERVKSFFAKLFTLIEVIIITTFLLFILMQFYPAKKYIYSSFKNSFSYPIIEKFYLKFLNDDFRLMILNQDTRTNHKELLFKSFKNSL